MNKPDFNKRMLELCRTVTPGEKLLLHSCCGPCSSRCLEKTAQLAKEGGYGWFCSTLSVSPHKNAAWLNELGEEIEKRTGVRWLYSDFKKENGYLRSVRLAQEHNLYRQNYCGCIFSDWTKNPSL